jgi:glycosyltransferase involved in cell wall biosynthesis
MEEFGIELRSKAQTITCDLSANPIMDPDSYCVLIRTLNSERTLPVTLRLLENQTRRPMQYVVVDSGSIDKTLNLLPAGCLIHRFVGKQFNYAEALNQGIAYATAEYVLIISSHTTLENPQAIELALDVLRSNAGIGAAYFCNENAGPLKHEIIDESNFDGFNGLWNTCSLVRIGLLRERPFRTDVFTAEDQEWARWLLAEKHMGTARLSGAGMVNSNPRARSLRKKANEYVAIAYFANRKLLGWRNIVRIGLRVITPRTRVAPRDRFYHLWLLCRLCKCHIVKPAASSRYC